MQKDHRGAAALAAFMMLALSVFLPLGMAPTASASMPTLEVLETLKNPSFDGAASAANGYELFGGAESVPIPRTGASSVDIAKGGASAQADLVLGKVTAYSSHAVLLTQVAETSWYQNYPARTTRTIVLEFRIHLDVDGNGVDDACLIHHRPNPTATGGWARVAFDRTASFDVADQTCSTTSAARTLSALQADPAYVKALVRKVSLQTVVDSTAPWPLGTPVYIDDMAFMATSSNIIRITQANKNACGGASFRDINTGLACALAGATVLVAPGTYPGPFVVDKAITLCAARTTDTSCGDSTPGVTLRGGGPVVLRITADGANVRGFFIDNPEYTAVDTAVSPVNPALVEVDANDVGLHWLRLRDPAAAPKPLESRQSVTAIRILPSSERVDVFNSNLMSMTPTLGPQATCRNAPCMTFGIDARAGTHDLEVRSTLFDMSQAPRSVALYAEGDGLIAHNSQFWLTGDGSDPRSTGIVGGGGARSGWFLRSNNFRPALGTPEQVSVGIMADLIAPRLEKLAFNDLVIGMMLHRFGRDAHIEDGQFNRNIQGFFTNAPGTTIAGTSFDGNDAAILIGPSSPGLTMRDAALSVPDGATSIHIRPGARNVIVDARENDWGRYQRASIRSTFLDEGMSSLLDESCYKDADKSSLVCPPIADFLWAPSDTHWRKNVQFINTSTSQGRPIALHAWDFGDTTTAGTRDPMHAFAAPGTYTVTLTVYDTEGYSGTATRVLRANNTPPVLAPIGDRNVAENQFLNFTLSATDAEQDPLTWSATGLPPGATFTPSTRAFSWRPTFEQEGTYPDVTFAVSDGPTTTTRSLTINVAHANAPPVVFIQGSTRGREGETISFLARATDVDGDALTLTNFPKIFGSTFVDHGNGTATFSWTPSASDVGTYNVFVQANDGTVSTKLPIQVIADRVNKAPVWSAMPTYTVPESQLLQFFVHAPDPDGDAVTYSAVSLPPGATFDPANRVFRWTPGHGAAGTYHPRFFANDGELIVSTDATIIVTKTNRPPTIATMANESLLFNRTLSTPLVASDPDGDVLSFTLRDAPAGMGVAAGKITWRPSAAQEGTHDITVAVTDGIAEATTSFRVTVGENLPPVVSAIIPERIEYKQVVRFVANAADPDGGGALSYIWDFDDRDGVTSQAGGRDVLTSYTSPGVRNITLRVTDVDGMHTTITIPIDVDDGLLLDLFLEEMFDPTRARFGYATLRDWAGVPMEGHTLDFVVTYKPHKNFDGVPLHRFTATTDHRGNAYFVTPRDFALFDAPERHVITVTATVPDSYQGDIEVQTASAEYGNLLT